MVADIEEYYLPDIIKDVIERVSEFFENRAEDSFSVRFDHGPYNQVGNDRLKDAAADELFIWLVMPFTEVDAKDDSYCSDVTCRLIIAIGTESNYTMEEREEENIFPFLIPVKRKLLEELSNESRFNNPVKVQSSNRILPYWGGGDVAAPGAPNLWKQNFDCIDLFDVKLKKENKKDCTPFTNM